MRYENPLYMAEEAAAADLLAGGRLQLGVSRGSPEPAWHGAEAFGYSLDREQALEKTALFRAAIAGAGVVRADVGGRPGEAMLAVQPQSPGLAERIWWGSGTRQSAVWAGEQGMNLMSSTLLLEDTKVPFDQLQAEQISLFREAWTTAGHHGEPRVSISRSVMPITSDLDRRLFGGDTNQDQVGWLDGAISRFGRSYTGEPDRIADELAQDAAVQEADTILLTVPSQLGVDYNAAMLETIAREIAPAFGWSASSLAPSLPEDGVDRA
jgi:alkanesulfonate monooxygenase SsuD/methylene tetrahydromethanopterin reductase-like flavin-dependent oxidoreductase (luciferase family)